MFFAGVSRPDLFRNDPMHTLADGDDINNLHIAHVGFGGDALLKHWSQRTGDQNADDSENHRERQEQNLCQRGFCQSKHRPG